MLAQCHKPVTKGQELCDVTYVRYLEQTHRDRKESGAVTEPARLEPVLRNKRGRDSERPAHRDEERPPLAATRESPRTETKTQHSHK